MKVLGLVLAVGLATAGCGGTGSGDSSSGSHVGGRLTVANPAPPTSLDPIAGSNGGDHTSLYPIYDRLVNLDPKTLDPIPGLAASWSFPDPKTLVLSLQSGVTFQDGTPMDAEAVKFSLERALNPDSSTVVSDLANIDNIEASGPLEVTIHLKAPDSSLVATLGDRAGMVVSPTAVKKWGKDFASHPVGAGPFSFVSYTQNDSMVLKKNATYWQHGKPSLDGITFKYFTDQQTANNALQSHQVDMVLNADLADLAALQKISDVKAVTATSLRTDGCYLNLSRAPFSNVEARRALAVGIDRDALNKSYAFGDAQPTSELFPADYWATDPSLQDTFSYDPDKATSLLEQAGYSDGVTIKGIAVQGTGEVRKMQIIQQQLKKVGMNLKFDVLDPAAASKAYFTDKTYDLVCSGWTGRPDPSQTTNSLLSPKSFYNLAGYAAPGIEQALAATTAAQTKEERAAAFSNVAKINQDYVVWLPLLSIPSITAVSTKVGDFEPNLLGKIDVSFVTLGS